MLCNPSDRSCSQPSLWTRSFAIAIACLVQLPSAHATTLTLTAPFDSVNFGKSVNWLPNGNLVVTDPSAGPSAVGAVYLYQPDGTLISTLKGGTANDSIGSIGIRVLPNGNFLVPSPNWRNGATASAGAVTFVNGTTGLTGTVSAANSLVGVGAQDSDSQQIIILTTGNYLVLSPLADFPGLPNRGAVTWGSGTVGVTGTISTTNSLSSPNAGGALVSSLAQLTNGNFVLGMQNWNGVGAAVWCPGSSGCAGSVDDHVALVGATPGDRVGESVTPLVNGHYVVASGGWDNGSTIDVGAVTWANGATGLDGTPTLANSWVGAVAESFVGDNGALALSNGHYVILSRSWINGSGVRAGAATWVNGTGPSSGVVDATNSIVGSTLNDGISNQYAALPNGNYLVGSSNWTNGAVSVAGALRWGNGLGGSVGPITPANALVGTTFGDSVGGRVEVLPNGNYVVLTPNWDNGAAMNAGAVTFGNGLTGISGPVSAANSLVGTSAQDNFGSSFRLLANGHVITGSSGWNNGAVQDVGIVTWMNGNTGGNGAVSGGNSLIGATATDRIGLELIALNNGNYLVLSRDWDGAVANLGAATFGNGLGGTTGFVSAANSLIGAVTEDGPPQLIGTALNHGDAIVGWPGFDRPGLANAGALVRVGGNGITATTLTAATAFVGSSTTENVGSPLPNVFSDDALVLTVSNWDTGVAPLNVGAVCLLDGRSGLSGQVDTNQCVLGTMANLGSTMVADYSPGLKKMAVGLRFENRVVMFDNSLFANGFE